MGPPAPLENIWEIRDCLWEKIQPVLLAADPPKTSGRKRVDQRRLLNGVVYKSRSGCEWNRLPKELGDDSTIHRTFQRWMRLGSRRPGSRVAGKWTVSRRCISGPSTMIFITPGRGGKYHTPGPGQWTIEMAQIAVLPSLEGRANRGRPSILNHPAIQAYVGRVNSGRLPGRDTDAADDTVNTAQPGTDIALIGEETERLQNDR